MHGPFCGQSRRKLPLIEGSFLGIAWSVTQAVDDVLRDVCGVRQFLRMSDGTRPYPVVLLRAPAPRVNTECPTSTRSSWTAAICCVRSISPNYIVVVSATIGALIASPSNLVVVLIFALVARAVHLAWGAAAAEYHRAVRHHPGIDLLMATMYVHPLDIAPCWEVLQLVFNGMPIIPIRSPM